MILIFRVDHRLLHGQVVFSWCSTLNPDCILVADDDVVNDELRKTTLKLGKPSGTKLVIKSIDDSIAAINGGKTDKYRLFAVVSNVRDAVRMALACDQITEIDLGGTKSGEDKRQVSRMVYLTPEEEALLAEAQGKGVDVYVQAVPSDARATFKPQLG